MKKIKIFLIIIISFIGAMGVDSLIGAIFAPSNWLFYQLNVYTEMITIFWIVGSVVVLFSINTLRKQSNKVKLMVSLIWLIIGYICITNVTFITENEIIVHTPLEPQGKVYEYNEIDHVEVSFGKRNLSLIESDKKGSFSYTIYLGEQKVIFDSTCPNEEILRYSEDTYLEIEEFDAALIQLGIKKDSDMTYVEYCDLDEKYVDRFVRIATTFAE